MASRNESKTTTTTGLNIIQLTPGAGPMYCGNCLRDNGLVAALRQMGHQAILAPLYLPLTLDEADQSAGTPVFLGGINVYLDQRFAFFRAAPSWLRRLLACAPAIAVGRRTRRQARAPRKLGELTLSMLRGEEGFQARELRGPQRLAQDPAQARCAMPVQCAAHWAGPPLETGPEGPGGLHVAGRGCFSGQFARALPGPLLAYVGRNGSGMPTCLSLPAGTSPS